MEITEQFKKEIEPFTWVDYSPDTGAGVCLTVREGGYLQEIFDTRADDGFIGNPGIKRGSGSCPGRGSRERVCGGGG